MPRILLVSPHGDGIWFRWLLEHEGHTVDHLIATEKDIDTLKGIVGPPLKAAPSPDKYDLILFDSSSMGDSADGARAIVPVIGSSEYADKLEHDRVFGLEVMEAAGIKVPKWHVAGSAQEGVAFLKQNNRRYVLKPIGDAPSDATYVSKSAADMIHFIEVKLDKKVKSFVLQEFVEGVEVSTEAWWTGSEFIAINHTLEEKKFMSGGIGPNTGCAGNVVWMPPKPNVLFQRGLGLMADQLRAANFVGMIDLNTIVTEGDAYGLEWTPRFGYEGTCNLTRLLPVGFGDFLYGVATGKTIVLGESRAKFAATIRLSVPPYPNAETNRKRVKVPVTGIDMDKLDTFVLYDVMKEGDEYVTSGTYNVIGSPIGVGASIAIALGEVEAAIKQLDIPNLMYRNDTIPCIEKRYVTLVHQGWLRSIG